MRLTSYAPTLFLDIKSCPGQAPACDLAHQQSQEESGVAQAACAGSVRGGSS